MPRGRPVGGTRGIGGSVPRPTGPSLETSVKQNEFIEAVFSGKYNYLAFGGGIRGTKTWTGLIILIMLMKMYPGSRWAIVRKDLPTLRRNTLPSINKLRFTVHNFLGEINQSTWTYTAENGSELIIFPESYATDPDLDRWKGLEVNGFLLEEANELVEKAFYKAIERAGSWVIPGNVPQPPILVLLTFNPAANWVRRIFYEPWRAGTMPSRFFFLPATVADNPWASDEYKESLKNLTPEDYRRFVLGEWEMSDDPDQLIKAEWIWDARNIESVFGRRKLGVDVARYGDDDSTFCLQNGNWMEFLRHFHGLSIDRVATTAAAFAGDEAHFVDPRDIILDAIGMGAGVADIMIKSGYHIYQFISGARAIPRKGSFYRFYNLRSQAWFECREKFRLGLLSLPEEIPPKLLADLTAPRYEITADRVIKVESKDDIKLRIGRSTDAGDSYVYSVFDAPPPPKRPDIVPSLSRVILR